MGLRRALPRLARLAGTRLAWRAQLARPTRLARRTLPRLARLAAGTAAGAALAVGCAGCGGGPAHPASAAHSSLPAQPSQPAAGRASPAAAQRPGTPPGCTAAVASGPALSRVRTSMTPVSGDPFGVVVAPDGRWAFVSEGDAVAVLRLHPAPSLVRTIILPSGNGYGEGEALADGGRYLLVAAGSGAVVMDVARAERGAAGAVTGTLSETVHGSAALVTAASSATQVVVAPGSRYAFVTLEYADEAAVFNLGRALAHGFTAADFIGNVPLGPEPVGMAFAPGGRWLYATSEQARPGTLSAADEAMGSLSVISVPRAETRPAASVVATAPAGCQPVRVITTGRGSVVWVTARASDALLGYSAAALPSGPSHALRADVRVGEAPVALAAVRGGSRLVVADSNRFSPSGAAGNLAVVNMTAALAGRPALLGYAKAGQFPREFALAPDGSTLYAANYTSGELESIAVGTLP